MNDPPARATVLRTEKPAGATLIPEVFLLRLLNLSELDTDWWNHYLRGLSSLGVLDLNLAVR